MSTFDDPVRLRAMAPRGSALERGLEAAHSSGPTDEQLRALERSVLTGIGLAGAVAATTVPAAKLQAAAVVTTWLSTSTAKLVVALALGSFVGGGVLVARRVMVERPQRRQAAVPGWRQPAAIPRSAKVTPIEIPAQPAPEPATEEKPAPPPAEMLPATGAVPRPAVVPPIEVPPQTAPAVVVEPAPPLVKKLPATAAARATAHSAIPAAAEEELRLLERANEALAYSPAQALALAEQHQRRFPVSIMDQERELIAITALDRLGRAVEARTRAESFSRTHASSIYRRQIEALLGKPQ